MGLEPLAMSDLNKMTPSEQKSMRPDGEPPKLCFYCKQPFPERAVGSQWAEVCLGCKRQRQHQLFEFPVRYQRITWDKCIVTDGNKEAIAAAKKWAEAGQGNLWFYGSPGSGKTHIAAAAMWEGPIGYPQFVNVAELLLEFQATVKEHDELTTIKFRAKHHQLFDDVAAHRISDFGIEMFGLLLERIYSNDIDKLIFTSNLSPKQILDTMGERIASRLRGLADPIKITGQDWRLKK